MVGRNWQAVPARPPSGVDPEPARPNSETDPPAFFAKAKGRSGFLLPENTQASGAADEETAILLAVDPATRRASLTDQPTTEEGFGL